MRSYKIIISLVGLVLIGTGGVALWQHRVSLQREVERASLPEAQQYVPEASAQVTPTPKSTAGQKPTPTKAAALPAQVNLAVPFTVQAPNANWSEPYGEFCEEASVLMAMSYIKHQPIPNAATADKELLAIKAFEDKFFGFYEDTTVAQTAQIFREYYKYTKVQTIKDPTVDQIKQAVAAGRLVIIPAAGRDLGNPYFQSPGPLYHMLVIKGYTNKGKFITNDPGTRHGADYLYDQTVIMNAIHDWRADHNIEAGAKVILVIG